uniref:Uncharacterized protein n=1 Tax=Romanomermis culicivorax TaxID=13658 RepID=A0A915IDP7_ROMCU
MQCIWFPLLSLDTIKTIRERTNFLSLLISDEPTGIFNDRGSFVSFEDNIRIIYSLELQKT